MCSKDNRLNTGMGIPANLKQDATKQVPIPEWEQIEKNLKKSEACYGVEYRKVFTDRQGIMQPITEASNEITENIDIASPAEIVSLLGKCDQEIFDGFKDFKSLFHEEILQTISEISRHVKEVLKNPSDGAVIFSGCGTSGRLGFITSRTFNIYQGQNGNQPVYQYLIAGDDKALFTSQEAIEDDPIEGAAALKKLTSGKRKVVYIGITCGLSAPYVAGQLDYCMKNLDVFTPVVIGFNPTRLARNLHIEKWDKTFLQVIQRLGECQDQGKGFILNPIVGPEPITGSSRMKSGTATKILLEAILVKAHHTMRQTGSQWNISDHLRCYREVCESVYRQTDKIKDVVDLAGQSLRSGGHIYYLGRDNLALLGLIDASECPPTYGATLDDVRGFVDGGYATLKNKEKDISNLGRHFRISTQDFVNDVKLSDCDTVIIINKDFKPELPECVRSAKCMKVLLTLVSLQDVSQFDVVIYIDTNIQYGAQPEEKTLVSLQETLFQEIAVKWCLNAISTGAHVLKGKVYKNIMIDVKVSNNKLFHRAVGILQKLGDLTKDSATEYLLRSVYDTDELSVKQKSDAIFSHITTATPKEKVVPVALLAAVGGVSIQQAKLELSKQPVVRTAVINALEKRK